MKETKKYKFILVKLYSILLLTLCTQISFAATYYPPSNQLRGGEIQSIAEHTYGKVEVRMYSENVTGTTSTFFWWKDGGHECGSQWNEIDIELIPYKNQYQSNPIWQTSDDDCEIELWEELHGDAGLYGRWVVYTVEWSPNHIAWYHDGKLDRWIEENDTKLAVNYIEQAMKYCFNLWTQGAANSGWLGDIDFDALQNNPVYQFVDYFKFYDWNGSGFNTAPTKVIDFSSEEELHSNFNVSDWEFGQSMGYLSWSKNAVGIADLGDGNSALWLGLFHSGQERAPVSSELPSSTENEQGPCSTVSVPGTIQEDTYCLRNGLETEISTDIGGGENLSFAEDGDWSTFEINVPESASYKVTLRVASESGGARIRLEEAGEEGAHWAWYDIAATGGWQNWVDVSQTVNLDAGIQQIGISWEVGGANLNYIKIEKEGCTTCPIEARIEAEDYISQSGTETEITTDGGGGSNVGWLDAGDWLRYNINPTETGTYKLTLRIASEIGGQLGLNNGQASINIQNTGGWQTWVNVTQDIQLNAGAQVLEFNVLAAGFNINWFELEKVMVNNDEDGDGVFDENDLCPASPAGQLVDSNGCEIIVCTDCPSESHIEAEDYSAQSGTETETTSDIGGGSNVGWLDAGDWLHYSINPLEAGTYKLTFRIASELGGQLGLNNGQATVNVQNTGGWQTWDNITQNVQLSAGVQTLELSVLAGAFNINWFEFEKTTANTDEDGDGVVDENDQCPGTEIGKSVDTNGCEIIEGGDCEGINIYPNWTTPNYEGGPNAHNEAGEMMVYEGNAYMANWYTGTIPGSDETWSFVKSCH